MDPQTGKYNEKTTFNLSENFRRKSPKILETHLKILNDSFEGLLQNLYPNFAVYYLKDLTSEYLNEKIKDYEVLRKFNKLTKYQVPEYLKEHNMNTWDFFIASMNPDKRQYNFFRQNFLPRAFQIKESILEGVKLLLKGKEILIQNTWELYACNGLLLKSGIFSDKQLINSDFASLDTSMFDLVQKWKWGVKREGKIYSYDMSKDSYLAKSTKKHFDKSDYIVSIKGECFSL